MQTQGAGIEGTQHAVKAGTVCVWHGWCPHTASQNASDQPRLALISRWNDNRFVGDSPPSITFNNAPTVVPELPTAAPFPVHRPVLSAQTPLRIGSCMSVLSHLYGITMGITQSILTQDRDAGCNSHNHCLFVKNNCVQNDMSISYGYFD